ncbi:hypothetical protein GCM10027294_38450 [Marinactinospora endophytica]
MEVASPATARGTRGRGRVSAVGGVVGALIGPSFQRVFASTVGAVVTRSRLDVPGRSQFSL